MAGGALKKLTKSLSLKLSIENSARELNTRLASNLKPIGPVSTSDLVRLKTRLASNLKSIDNSAADNASRRPSGPSNEVNSRICESATLRPSAPFLPASAPNPPSLKARRGRAIFTSECSHHFHFNCIVSNVRHGNRICPICRSEWKDIPFEAPRTKSAISESRSDSSGDARVIVEDTYGPLLHVMSQLSLPRLESELFHDDEPLPPIHSSHLSSTQPKAITIKAFPEFQALSASSAVSKFAVLVGIHAHPFDVGTHHFDRAPIDVVAVLDVSGSSMANKFTLLKRAVCFLIQCLGPLDRLSIVVFSSLAQRILPLRRMTYRGRDDATRAINSLSSLSGGKNIVEGLSEGIKILEERCEQNPVARIILMSDGHETNNDGRHALEYLNHFPNFNRPGNHSESEEGSQNLTIPVHSFGFGLENDLSVMHTISDASGGIFSFIESIDTIQDAFGRCIGGLFNVVLQDVQLTISSISAGIQIDSISSGRYRGTILNQGRQARLDVGRLYAYEKKEFLVYLSIPALPHDKDRGLLDVLCTYRDSVKKMFQAMGERVVIRRPEVLYPKDKVICFEVDRERNHAGVAEAIANARQMAKLGALEQAQAVLVEQRSALLSSVSGQVGDSLCNLLEDELKEIRRKMVNTEMHELTRRAHTL
ncbi:hypothetical protein SLEP1_g6406 [Rubroshorea leprosula]|uniref:Uncharacterized protein n=1 Tax=Rubroshorea leprosula TaxID=152421 RepID=A0AAV5I4W9_9ROSI|nr:hypothetical protein SLEP1_g6406 [Rubroshorea leprosula]